MSMIRIAFASTTPALRAGTRAFHISPIATKSATERVKEVASDVRVEVIPHRTLTELGQVNIMVGKKLASAIEKGEEATEATKETLGLKLTKNIAPAAEKAKQAAEQARQRANQTSAGVREGTQDFKEDVKKQARK
ncbi:hypothetical protein C8Q72DRAFT_792168 [Fomitopsis betulina]|nr:hypothetical protein C8Q72DRAFT_792168 [Fomitopsis betulina]